MGNLRQLRCSAPHKGCRRHRLATQAPPVAHHSCYATLHPRRRSSASRRAPVRGWSAQRLGPARFARGSKTDWARLSELSERSERGRVTRPAQGESTGRESGGPQAGSTSVLKPGGWRGWACVATSR